MICIDKIEKNIFIEWNYLFKIVNSKKNRNSFIDSKDLHYRLKKLLILQLVNNS